MTELDPISDPTAQQIATEFKLLTLVLTTLTANERNGALSDVSPTEPRQVSERTLELLDALTIGTLIENDVDLPPTVGVVKYTARRPDSQRLLEIRDIGTGYVDASQSPDDPVYPTDDLSRRWVLSMGGRVDPAYRARGMVYEHGLFIPPVLPEDARFTDGDQVGHLVGKFAVIGTTISYWHTKVAGKPNEGHGLPIGLSL